MNEINEKISVKDACQRKFDVRETLAVLQSNVHIFWSWGVHALTTNETGTMLRFMVNGKHFRGHVYIFLGWEDLYNVYLTTSKGTIKHKVEGLYFDQLTEWIDRKVERIKEYQF